MRRRERERRISGETVRQETGCNSSKTENEERERQRLSCGNEVEARLCPDRATRGDERKRARRREESEEER